VSSTAATATTTTTGRRRRRREAVQRTPRIELQSICSWRGTTWTFGSAVESETTYALCYKCHSRTSILSDASFKQHNRHLGLGASPCSVCHDPHGIQRRAGQHHQQQSPDHFDTRFVSPSVSGLLRFESIGQGSGRCYLNCHGKEHTRSAIEAAMKRRRCRAAAWKTSKHAAKVVGNY